MSKAPSMPMFWDAYLADTTHLSTLEHGAYMLLLAAMWRRDGYVPDDDKDNARILGLTLGNWRKIKARLLSTVRGVIIENGTITQQKLLKTWQKTQEKIDVNKSNGARGGRPKSNENNDLAKPNGSISVNPIVTTPEPEPYKVKRIDKSIPKKAEAFSVDDLYLFQNIWNNFAKQNGLAGCRDLTSSRKSSLRQRLIKARSVDALEQILLSCADMPHLMGENGWRMNFDFFTKESSFNKIIDGNYINDQKLEKPSTSLFGEYASRVNEASDLQNLKVTYEPNET